MKRLLVIPIIASMTSTVCAQALHPSERSPHGGIAVMLLLVCVLLAVSSAAVLISRARRHRRLSAAREARMLQQLVAQAAALRKPMESGVQTKPRTASCYWSYQARQLEVDTRS